MGTRLGRRHLRVSALRRHDYRAVIQKVASENIADAVVAVVRRAADEYPVPKHVNGNQERGRERREGSKANVFGGRAGGVATKNRRYWAASRLRQLGDDHCLAVLCDLRRLCEILYSTPRQFSVNLRTIPTQKELFSVPRYFF